LGVIFNSNLKWNDNIDYLIAKAKKKSNSLLCSLLRYKYLSTEAKLNIWNSIVRPILEYGSAMWWCNKLQSQRIERIQLKALKVILGISSKTTDIAVRLELGVMSLEMRRKLAMLKWAAKICRMSDKRLVKNIFDSLNFKWTGRGRARRQTWKKKVQLILKEFGIEHNNYSSMATLKQSAWNNIVNKAAVKIELLHEY